MKIDSDARAAVAGIIKVEGGGSRVIKVESRASKFEYMMQRGGSRGRDSRTPRFH